VTAGAEGTTLEPPADEPASRRSRWWWLALVPVVAFALLLASGLGRDPNELPSELVGRTAPAFLLPALSGDTNVDLAELKGNVVVVNFWASWCAECRDEHPALLNAWDRYRDRGVVFVGVDFEDSAEDAAAYAREMGGDWPLATDPGSRAAIDFGVFGVPETFVLDADGTIVAKQVGPVDYEWLTSAIERALGGSAA
jgi:cytochrome c biogenesis protein CcmG/thiol:disulfide interchange protein DsbE